MTLHLQTRLRINLSDNPTPFSFGSDNFRQSFVPQLTSNSLTPKRGPDSSQTPWIGVGRRIGRARCSDARMLGTRLRSCTSGPGPGISDSDTASAPAPQNCDCPGWARKIQGEGSRGVGGAGDQIWKQGLLCYVVAFPDIGVDKGKTSNKKKKADLRKQKAGVLQRENQNEKPAVYINEFPNCCHIPDSAHRT